MKLAEALLLRADLQKKVASLRDRIVANAVVQEGDKPHEAPDQLMKEAFGALAELETLMSNPTAFPASGDAVEILNDFAGAGHGSRTRDLRLGKPTLYQLS
jgi:hypothetical protein